LICSFASKVILFQEALQYYEAIVHSYRKQIVGRISVLVPPPPTWHVAQIVVDVRSLIVSTCVLNQSHGHWFSIDILHSAITMNTKIIEKLQNPLTFDNIKDEDLGWLMN
jgi:hypothetical protein